MFGKEIVRILINWNVTVQTAVINATTQKGAHQNEIKSNKFSSKYPLKYDKLELELKIREHLERELAKRVYIGSKI